MTKVARVRNVDVNLEKQIVTAAIISTEYLQSVASLVEPKHFKSKYIQTVMEWVLSYFKEYNEAPNREIERIYRMEARTDTSEANLIRALLEDIEERADESLNVSYMVRKSLDYIKKRDLTIRAQDALNLLEKDEVTEAEMLMRDIKDLSLKTSNWINPFDSKQFAQVVNDDDPYLFMPPGAMGKLIGPVKRGWFGLFLGPMKRGKTFNMFEWVLHMVLNRLRVAFISLEMSNRDMNERFYKRILSVGAEARDYTLPCWDCRLNQDGSCERPERSNDLTLISEETGGIIPPYTREDPYRPCTVCMESGVRENGFSPYEPSSWFSTLKRKSLGPNRWNDVKEIGFLYQQYLRCISYPKFSRSFNDVANDLYILEQNEGFIPDAVVIDYEGILKCANPKLTGRDAVNDTIMTMAGWAAETETFLLSASQTNRGGYKDFKGKMKESIEADDQGEDWRKNAHVDFLMSINQLPEEKRRGLGRIGVIAHRHKETDDQVQALMLQQLQLGQVCLDSMLVRVVGGKYAFIDK